MYSPIHPIKELNDYASDDSVVYFRTNTDPMQELKQT